MTEQEKNRSQEKAQEIFRGWDQAIASMYTAIETVYDIMDPVRFEGILDKVLRNKNVSKSIILKNTPYGQAEGKLTPEAKEMLEEQIVDYGDWKRLQLQVLQTHRMQWRKKLILQHIKSSDTMMGAPDTYTRLVHSAIGTELIDGFQKSKQITEAEKANDRGNDLRERGRFSESLEYFDQAISLSQRFCLPRVNKGISLKNLGRIGEAISVYQLTLNIDPNYKKAWHNMGVALAVAGDVDGAEKSVGKALEIDPDYQIALKLRGRLG